MSIHKIHLNRRKDSIILESEIENIVEEQIEPNVFDISSSKIVEDKNVNTLIDLEDVQTGFGNIYFAQETVPRDLIFLENQPEIFIASNDEILNNANVTTDINQPNQLHNNSISLNHDEDTQTGFDNIYFVQETMPMDEINMENQSEILIVPNGEIQNNSDVTTDIIQPNQSEPDLINVYFNENQIPDTKVFLQESKSLSVNYIEPRKEEYVEVYIDDLVNIVKNKIINDLQTNMEEMCD